MPQEIWKKSTYFNSYESNTIKKIKATLPILNVRSILQRNFCISERKVNKSNMRQ